MADFSPDATGHATLSEDSLRHLIVLGQKPALMIGFLIMGSDLKRSAEAQEQYLNQALEYAEILQQPYEQALIRFLRAKLISEQPDHRQRQEHIRQDISKALALAEQLKARQLHQHITQLSETLLSEP